MSVLSQYKSAPFVFDLNKFKIPVTEFKSNDEGMQKFNEIFFYLRDNFRKGIEWTNSGGISLRNIFMRVPMWDITPCKAKSRTCIEIVAIVPEGCFRFIFGHEKSKENRNINGHTAFITFCKECLKDGVVVSDYYIDNGIEVKKEIEKPLIGLVQPYYNDMIFEPAHHIDTRNAWPAALALKQPQLAKTIQRIFDGRSKHPTYKAVLNFSIGYMQSVNNFGAKLAHFSRDAINYSNERLRELAKRVEAAGRQIIAFNTDGFWYYGDIYHGEGEGNGLGEWRNDHLRCKLRFKSDGAYEYIEDGKYYPVVRGRTNYDTIQDRENWKWGDIYRKDAKPMLYGFSCEYGIIKREDFKEYDIDWRIDD